MTIRKAVTYSIGASVIGASIVWAATGSLATASWVAVVDRGAKLVWYIIHDWLWRKA